MAPFDDSMKQPCKDRKGQGAVALPHKRVPNQRSLLTLNPKA